MKTFLTLLSLLFVQGVFAQIEVSGNYQKHDSIKTHVEFLEKPHLSAKDYIVSLFDNYDFVIFVERMHAETTQYDLLMDVFADKRFQDQVGHIFHEIGGAIWDKEYNDYLHAPNLSQEQSRQRALKIQREMSWYPVWVRGNYHRMLTGLYEINRSLPKNKKLSLHPTDLSADWKNINSREFVRDSILMGQAQFGRDSIMVNSMMNVINNNRGKRKKYFAILNSLHGTFHEASLFGYPYIPAGMLLKQQYKGRIANVLINTRSFTGNGTDIYAYRPVWNGKWDAAFEYLGLDDVGFDIKNSPIAEYKDPNITSKDTSIRMKDAYIGYAFYRSLPKQLIQEGVPGLINDAFAKELVRRISLFDRYEELPNPEDALKYFNKRYNGEKRTNVPNLDVMWTEVLKWIKEKPLPDYSGNNVPFSAFDDGNVLTAFVDETWKWFRTHAKDAGFTLDPPLKHSLMTTPLLVYFDSRNTSMHYTLWSDLDAQSKAFFNQIAGNDEAEAKKIFGLFFNGFYVPHEMAHYLSHISGDKARLHTYEGELFANQLAMVVWREIMPERALKNVYESAKNILPKLKNPVPEGENEAKWFSKNYNKIVESQDPYTYGYFQFSQIVKVYEDETLKKKTLDGFLENYKKEVEKIK